MEKLISAGALLNQIDSPYTEYPVIIQIRRAIREMIEEAPAVDAKPVIHGHWIRNDNGTYSCSECQSWIPNEQHYYARYCLHCGAKMDGEENETNVEC